MAREKTYSKAGTFVHDRRKQRLDTGDTGVEAWLYLPHHMAEVSNTENGLETVVRDPTDTEMAAKCGFYVAKTWIPGHVMRSITSLAKAPCGNIIDAAAKKCERALMIGEPASDAENSIDIDAFLKA